MQRRRFYSPPEDFAEASIILSKEETHHLLRVLRLTPGDDAYVFDGLGSEFRCRFASLESDRARLEIVVRLDDEVESPAHVTLAQALAKGERFDLVVQKSTELGVSEIVPLITANTDVKLDDERASRRMDRWQRISLEAMKQSGRRTLVEISDPVSLKGYLQLLSSPESSSHICLLCDETGGSPLGSVLTNYKGQKIIAFVGPEGGWEENELDSLHERGARSVTLGPRVLRTETAGIVALTLIQNQLGDLSR